MTYKNTDNTVLRHSRLIDVELGAKVVFHNDGSLEDIHIVMAHDGDEVITQVEVISYDYNQTKRFHPFVKNGVKRCYILEDAPSRTDILFDEH